MYLDSSTIGVVVVIVLVVVVVHYLLLCCLGEGKINTLHKTQLSYSTKFTTFWWLFVFMWHHYVDYSN